MLYEMLTGRPPFKGVSALDTMKQVIERDPVSPSHIQYRVPRDLETVCLKCLQKEPRKRYTTAKEMAEDLNRYLRGEPIKGRRTPPIEARRNGSNATRLPPWGRRSRSLGSWGCSAGASITLTKSERRNYRPPSTWRRSRTRRTKSYSPPETASRKKTCSAPMKSCRT